MGLDGGRAGGWLAAVKSGYCHQMLMECRTNRYNNRYMVLLPAGVVGGGEGVRIGVPKLVYLHQKCTPLQNPSKWLVCL